MFFLVVVCAPVSGLRGPLHGSIGGLVSARPGPSKDSGDVKPCFSFRRAGRVGLRDRGGRTSYPLAANVDSVKEHVIAHRLVQTRAHPLHRVLAICRPTLPLLNAMPSDGKLNQKYLHAQHCDVRAPNPWSAGRGAPPSCRSGPSLEGGGFPLPTKTRA